MVENTTQNYKMLLIVTSFLCCWCNINLTFVSLSTLPRPRPTETTFIQAAGDAPISSEIHTPHQDNSQTQTYDNLPSHSGQLDSQRIVISPQTVQPEEPPPVASRADPEGGDGIIPLGQISTDNDPQQAALVPGMMASSMPRRMSGQHAQEQYQDRPQTPESAPQIP